MRLSLIVFDVGGTRLALDRQAVHRVLPLPHLARPPTLPDVLDGFARIDGQAVPVLALDRLLGIAGASLDAEAAIYRHLLLLHGLRPEGLTALLVDRVLDIVAAEPDALMPVDDGKTLNGCVTATIAIDGAPVHLIGIDRLLMAEERRLLSDLAVAAAERIERWSPA